jgi:hypothetical protein
MALANAEGRCGVHLEAAQVETAKPGMASRSRSGDDGGGRSRTFAARSGRNDAGPARRLANPGIQLVETKAPGTAEAETGRVITETIDGREDAQQLDPRKGAAASTKGSGRVQASHQPKPKLISMPRLPWHVAAQR